MSGQTHHATHVRMPLCLLLLTLGVLVCGCAQEQAGDSYDLNHCDEIIELRANALKLYPVFGVKRPFPVFVCDPPAFHYQACVHAELSSPDDTCRRAYVYVKKVERRA